MSPPHLRLPLERVADASPCLFWMAKHRQEDPRVVRGRAGEALACRELERRGYVILARNERLAGVEIDIIARDADTLVFVEVRSRSSVRFGSPASTVDSRKQSRIARAAAAYVAARAGGEIAVRFDVIGIVWGDGTPHLELFPGAFSSPF